MANTAQTAANKHPLQRLSSPSRSASALLHVSPLHPDPFQPLTLPQSLGLASFTSSFFYLTQNPTPINASFGWHFQYLTIIGLTLAALTFFFGLLADITLSPSLFSLKNALSVSSAPLAVLISILYWSLRAIDINLVLPPWAPRLATSADLGFHAIPAIGLVVDLLLFSPPYAISALPALALSSAIAVVYWFWVEACYARNGFWPYPIFEEVGYYGRIGLFVGSAGTMLVSLVALKWVYARVNGSGMDVRRQPGKGR